MDKVTIVHLKMSPMFSRFLELTILSDIGRGLDLHSRSLKFRHLHMPQDPQDYGLQASTVSMALSGRCNGLSHWFENF